MYREKNRYATNVERGFILAISLLIMGLFYIETVKVVGYDNMFPMIITIAFSWQVVIHHMFDKNENSFYERAIIAPMLVALPLFIGYMLTMIFRAF